MTPTALVVGAGISGLSCARRLREDGFDVRLVSRERPEHTTSAVAAAVWFPYAAEPAERVHAWALRSYRVYAQEASHEPCVWMSPLRALFREAKPAPDWSTGVTGFAAVPAGELPEGFTAGYRFEVPIAEMPAYLEALEARLGRAGVVIELNEVGDLAELDGAADVVVLCAGLGAGALTNDDLVFPIWGDVVLVERCGLDHVLLDEDHPGGPTYAIPRRTDVVLGGSALHGVTRDGPDAVTGADIIARCASHVPALADAAILARRAAARPGRKSVRVELDRLPGGTPIVYNYGHGGCGMTVAWGCAEEVSRLALGALAR